LRLVLGLNRVQEPDSLYYLLKVKLIKALNNNVYLIIKNNLKNEKEHTKLDVTKFFNWQKSNSMSLFSTNSKEDNNEISKKDSNYFYSQLLSFENEPFASKYSYKTSLDYAFFVKQGRPFFAYHYFIKEQLNKYGKLHKTL
jgi:hypothetical protein